MNPYGIIGSLVLWVGSIGFTYYWAYGAGRDNELATQAREDKAAQVSRDAALSAAAEAISKIEVKHVQIRQPLETIVRTEQVFRDCRSGSDAMRLLNSTPGIAQTAASAASGVQLSGASATH